MVENNTDEQETVEISAETLATLIHETSITLNQMRNNETPPPIMEQVAQAFDEANETLDESLYSTPPYVPNEADALVHALEEADELAAQMNDEGDDEVDNWEPDFLK